VGVLGPNGAGKSTLLRAILGLQPCRGEVRLKGDVLAKLSPLERAQRIGLVPQQTALRASLRVREVVEQGRYAARSALNGTHEHDREQVAWALATTDLTDFAERRFPTLSCGEQRRVIIARTIASGARVLCLDEPAAALDIRHTLDLYALLRHLADSGYAIVVVLHELSDALLHTDRSLLLDRGRCAGFGATAQVLDSRSIQRTFGVTPVRRAAFGFRLAAASWPLENE